MERDSERIYDEYLVAAARTGDHEALGRLVERWQPRLLRHAWRTLGDPERARDMVQESWVEILRGLRRLDDPVAFPAWAFRIVTRRCQRQFRRSAREPFEPEAAGEGAAPAVPEHDTAEFTVDVSRVMQAIATLPAPQRAALALFHTEGLSVAEIAIALDVPPGTVKTRLMHARRKVRALFEGHHDGQA
jgi:RNA polymerase sigma factor (sigma-70 family)